MKTRLCIYVYLSLHLFVLMYEGYRTDRWHKVLIVHYYSRAIFFWINSLDSMRRLKYVRRTIGDLAAF